MAYARLEESKPKPKRGRFQMFITGVRGSGKTSLGRCYNNQDFEENPAFFDSFHVDINCCPATVYTQIFDSPDGDTRDIRRRFMNFVDICILCFSVDNPKSMTDLQDDFVSDIRSILPNKLFILVATKVDLRNDQATIERLNKENKHPVTENEGMQLARFLRAYAYVECSSKTGYKVKDIFQIAGFAVMAFEGELRAPNRPEIIDKSKECILS